MAPPQSPLSDDELTSAIELLHRLIPKEAHSPKTTASLRAGHLSGNRLHQSRHFVDAHTAEIGRASCRERV